jgi:hypothetical protein
MQCTLMARPWDGLSSCVTAILRSILRVLEPRIAALYQNLGNPSDDEIRQEDEHWDGSDSGKKARRGIFANIKLS